MGDTVKLTGDRQLERMLRGLPRAVEQDVLPGSLAAAMEPVLDEVLAEIPRESGETAAAIEIRVSTSDDPKAGVGIFGPARGGDDNDFATLKALEFGTAHQPGMFILRRALASRRRQALRALQGKLAKGVDKAAAALARGTPR